ncbi:MAG: cupin domain-containing protein [Bacteroidota bacterium]|nr:cupin domain-containing protein [Bacteroidota bacterium]
MFTLSVQQIIQQFEMQPHPEGGYFKETYRSRESIAHNALPSRFAGERNFSTAIYFLLEQGNFSAFHKIQSDECWHFYAGDALNIYVIDIDGILQTIRLGSDIQNGEVFQYVVPAGCWFASEPAVGSIYSFVGCTVAPGFDFEDFILASADTLQQLYPQHAGIIRRLCR